MKLTILMLVQKFGLDGQVFINVIEENIDRDLVPNQYPLLSVSEALAKSCLVQQGRKKNRIRFNVLGKGGFVSQSIFGDR